MSKKFQPSAGEEMVFAAAWSVLRAEEVTLTRDGERAVVSDDKSSYMGCKRGLGVLLRKFRVDDVGRVLIRINGEGAWE